MKRMLLLAAVAAVPMMAAAIAGLMISMGPGDTSWTPTIDIDADVHQVATAEGLVLAACASQQHAPPVAQKTAEDAQPAGRHSFSYDVPKAQQGQPLTFTAAVTKRACGLRAMTSPSRRAPRRTRGKHPSGAESRARACARGWTGTGCWRCRTSR